MGKTLIEVFSFWIFVWFLLYYFNLIPFSPIFIFLLALLLMLIGAVFIIPNKDICYYNKIKYCLLNISMKLIPILLIIKLPLIIYIYDIYFGIFIFIIYMIVMKFMNKNIIQTYKELYLSNFNDDYKQHRGFMSRYYDYIYDFIIKIFINNK